MSSSQLPTSFLTCTNQDQKAEKSDLNWSLTNNATLPQSLNGGILSVHTWKDWNHVFWLTCTAGIFSYNVWGKWSHWHVCVSSVACCGSTSFATPARLCPASSSVHATQARILKSGGHFLLQGIFLESSQTLWTTSMSPALAGWLSLSHQGSSYLFFSGQAPYPVRCPEPLFWETAVLMSKYIFKAHSIST